MIKDEYIQQMTTPKILSAALGAFKQGCRLIRRYFRAGASLTKNSMTTPDRTYNSRGFQYNREIANELPALFNTIRFNRFCNMMGGFPRILLPI